MEAIWNFIGFVFTTLGDLGDAIRTGLREFLAPAITDPFIPFYVSVLLTTSVVWVVLKLTIFKDDNYRNFVETVTFLTVIFSMFALFVSSHDYHHALTKGALWFIDSIVIIYYIYAYFMGNAITNFTSSFRK